MAAPTGGRALSRRHFLQTAATATGVAVVGGIGGLVGYELAGVGSAAPVSSPPTDAAASPDAGGGAAAIVPFRDVHQAGIATPAQDRLAFAAFDVTGHDRAAVVTLLRAWTAAAERMTRGEAVDAAEADPLAPPDDTGESMGLRPGRLTITIGFGPSLFDDRFGLAASRPAAMAELPRFAGDFVEPGRSGGDLGIQACADDPQVAFTPCATWPGWGGGPS